MAKTSPLVPLWKFHSFLLHLTIVTFTFTWYEIMYRLVLNVFSYSCSWGLLIATFDSTLVMIENLEVNVVWSSLIFMVILLFWVLLCGYTFVQNTYACQWSAYLTHLVTVILWHTWMYQPCSWNAQKKTVYHYLM